MIAAFITLALGVQTVQLGTVDVGGRQVAVTVPSLRGPFGPGSPHVVIDGYSFEVKPDMNLGVRYKSDGGWGEVADSYPAAAAKSASAPEYRIKVYIIENTLILEEGRDGVWRERPGSLSNAIKDEIYSSLARLKALAETAADGGVRLTFDVTVDTDLVFRVSREGVTHEYRPSQTEVVHMTAPQRPEEKGLLGPGFIYDEIGPRVNNDAFEIEDGKYRGPYSSVFVIHGLKSWDAVTYLLDRTPVSSFSWSTFTDREPGPALSIQLFYAWLQHLGVSARAALHDVAFTGSLPTGDDLPKVPRVFDTLVTPTLLKYGNRLQSPGYGDGVAERKFGETDFSIASARALNFEVLPPIRKNDNEIAVGWLPPKDARTVQAGSFVAVHPAVVVQFMQNNPAAKPKGRIENAGGGWDYVLFEGAAAAENDARALGVEIGSFPAMRMIGPSPTVGKVEFSPSKVGEFEAKLETDPSVGPIVTVQEQGAERRGYAVLASSNGGDALFRVEAGSGISFKASCDLIDPYVLRLVTRKGRTVDVQLFGKSQIPAEARTQDTVIDASRRRGPFWNEFNVPLGASLAGEEIVEIRLAPPQYAECYERPSDGSKSLKIGVISFGPAQTGEQPLPEQMSADLKWLIDIKAPLDETTVGRLRTILHGDDLELRINALAALTAIKQLDLIPDIGPLTSSGFPGESFLAFKALMHQDTDKAWSEIAFAAIRGPFGANFMFAAEALGTKKEDVTLEILGMALLSSSWHARLAAVRAVNGIESEQSAIVSSATLGSTEPDPAVRFAIVSKSRPESGLFSRRVLFAAVNDDSEWVRTRSYLALIDNSAEEIKNDALKGVRDDSVGVRLAILAAMTASPKEHYRPALRSAVVDIQAVVRAAALRAFAVQPGEVVVGEIQNTLTDPSPLVRAALQELAKAKGLQIPPSK